ncbi:MAG: 1-(5-phosphoribosyl)-5-[(5-phosphoribosylamino)methylideneamino]imidazole-4-carboxamide isomerase [Rikenellaceae bacterium]
MKIEIIPAIDIIGGECVRLVQGDYSQKTSYFKNPVEVAKRYEAIGVKRLHIVDLDGAKKQKPVNISVLEDITSLTSLDVQWGGGVKSQEALDMAFEAGAARVICGSVAITNSDLFQEWLTIYGASRIILGADTKEGSIAINGWEKTSEISVEELIKQFLPFGLSQVICTDISKDGMLQGPSFELYEKLYSLFPDLNITVSGGVRNCEDIEKLDRMNVLSVVVGKAIYEGKIKLIDLERCLQNE